MKPILAMEARRQDGYAKYAIACLTRRENLKRLDAQWVEIDGPFEVPADSELVAYAPKGEATIAVVWQPAKGRKSASYSRLHVRIPEER